MPEVVSIDSDTDVSVKFQCTCFSVVTLHSHENKTRCLWLIEMNNFIKITIYVEILAHGNLGYFV